MVPGPRLCGVIDEHAISARARARSRARACARAHARRLLRNDFCNRRRILRVRRVHRVRRLLNFLRVLSLSQVLREIIRFVTFVNCSMGCKTAKTTPVEVNVCCDIEDEHNERNVWERQLLMMSTTTHDESAKERLGKGRKCLQMKHNY